MALCLLIVIVSACSQSSAPTVVGGAIISYTGSPPADCSPTTVAETVLAFLDAFNRGDQEALRRMFQRSVIFSASGAPDGFFLSSGQPALLKYFSQRHAHRETLELTALQVSYREGSSEAGLGPRINRRADDIAPAVVTAKGAIDCNDRAIILWNQGGA